MPTPETKDTALPPAAQWVASYPAFDRGLLLSHSCLIAQPEDEAQETGMRYDHPYRWVAPVLDLQAFAEPGSSLWDSITVEDKVVPLMYLPAAAPRQPACVALLFRAQLVLHDNLGNRIAQMAHPGAQWLQVKLARLVTGTWLQKANFDPPMT